jgi:hypothetical protein
MDYDTSSLVDLVLASTFACGAYSLTRRSVADTWARCPHVSGRTDVRQRIPGTGICLAFSWGLVVEYLLDFLTCLKLPLFGN